MVVPNAISAPLDDLVGSMRRERPWLAGAIVLALVLHVAARRALPTSAITVLPPPSAPTDIIDIELPRPPPPPPPPPEEERPPEATSPRTVTNAPGKPATPANAPAAAAAVLTSAPDENAPLDLTNTFVTGSGATYVGGLSASTGTAARALRSIAPTTAMGAAPDVTPARSAGPDRSRRAATRGASAWDCPFPAEADADTIDRAVVTIRVLVDAAGALTNIAVVTDPGHGFARAATQCARNKSWTPALDRDGNALEGAVTLNVRFER